MRKFDAEKYLGEGEKAYSQRENVEKLADDLTKRGFDNIVVIGIGGTYDIWHPVVHVMRHHTDLPIYLENAAELIIKKDKNYLTKNSLVVTASASGDTKEILEVVDMCRDMHIDVAGFTKSKENELGKRLDYCILSPNGDCENSYMLFFMLMLRILFNRGEFKNYQKFADQMKVLHKNLLRIREEFEPRAIDIAQKYAKEPYSIFVSSGALWGETVLYSMCILEEEQWKRTRAVSSADFFHGTLELVEPGVPVFLFKGEDEYRQLDERVERFCTKFTDKFVVLDVREFNFEGIDDEFRVICSPMILTALFTDRVATNYELVTGHSLEFRRYYRQIEY